MEVKLELVKKLSDFNIVLYTGYELDDIPKEFLENIEYIKVGKFDKNKHSTTMDYLGSSNQRFIPLRRVEQ